jgi:hypothetical protein
VSEEKSKAVLVELLMERYNITDFEDRERRPKS